MKIQLNQENPSSPYLGEPRSLEDGRGDDNGSGGFDPNDRITDGKGNPIYADVSSIAKETSELSTKAEAVQAEIDSLEQRIKGSVTNLTQRRDALKEHLKGLWAKRQQLRDELKEIQKIAGLGAPVHLANQVNDLEQQIKDVEAEVKALEDEIAALKATENKMTSNSVKKAAIKMAPTGVKVVLGLGVAYLVYKGIKYYNTDKKAA